MILCNLKGRLGNQLFIYAFAYALSKENSDEPILLCRGREEPRLGAYPLRNLIPQAPLPHKSLVQKGLRWVYARAEAGKSREGLFRFEKRYARLLQKNGLFYCQNGFLPLSRRNCDRKEIELNGFFQSERYFAPVRDDLLQMLVPIAEPTAENAVLLRKIRADRNSVCVDFRLDDYVNNPLHGVCTPDYYRKAIARLSETLENPTFYIFSTDVDVARQMLDGINGTFVFESGRDADFEKLRVMSACSHFIITNSTFDWWAQYLSENPGKTVIAPSRWFAQPCPCDIYQNHWTLVDP